MSLVKVWTDVGGKKPNALLAKIVEKDGVIFTIKYLTADKDNIWRYEDETYDVDDDSIAEYLKTDDETTLGFRKLDDGFIQDVESDEDYEPEDEEEDDDEDDDEDEENEEDMNEEEYNESEEEDEDEEENVEEY
jgi:hypothetical protein